MGAGNASSRLPDGDNVEARDAEPTQCQPVAQTPRLSHQIILRHLSKLRDGAHAVLGLFGADDSERESPHRAGAAPPPPAPAVSKTPLEERIERHMATLHRALEQIQRLNPDHKQKNALTPEVRAQIAVKERTIHDIVGAELHFWAATIESAPLERLDDVERQWVHRMLRLADIVGVDREHSENLKFLQDWASQKHS